jgi:class 3 adenylate cyclase
MERKLATIVAMDVVGYSRLMELDEAGTLQRLKEMHGSVLTPAISRHRGRVVKLIGDGILAEFTSVVDALECAVEIQRQVASGNGTVPLSRRLQLRIGLHLGDIIVEGNDIYGDGVNVASRLEGLAEPGGIVLSKQVHDHIGSNVSVRLASIGDQTVKNISRPIHAYRVDFGAESESGRIIRFRGFELDTSHFELREKGERVPIEPQVFDLLVLLARNASRTITKEEIFSEIWGDRIVSESALSSQIKAVRRAVGDDGATQHTIATVHGRGFRFVAPIQAEHAAAEAAVERTQAVISVKPTVAVLPFGNLNADASEDFLADGITEDITTLLAKNRWLGVVARNPAFAFRGSSESLRVVGQKLGADYLVTGSVRRGSASPCRSSRLRPSSASGRSVSIGTRSTSSSCRTTSRATSPRASRPSSVWPSRKRRRAARARTSARGISISWASPSSISSPPRPTSFARITCGARSSSIPAWRRRIHGWPTRSS